MPADKNPFPRWGEHLQEGVVPPRLTGTVEPASTWPVPLGARIRFCAWVGSLFSVALALTVAVVEEALRLAPHHTLSEHYIVGWSVVAAASLGSLCLLGGVVVFRRNTPWSVVGLWPLVGGPAVAAGYWFGVADQMDTGSKLCGPQQSCDLSWGLGAMAVAIIATPVVAGLFVFAFALKRTLLRLFVH